MNLTKASITERKIIKEMTPYKEEKTRVNSLGFFLSTECLCARKKPANNLIRNLHALIGSVQKFVACLSLRFKFSPRNFVPFT
jgi:hypothetical protein